MVTHGVLQRSAQNKGGGDSRDPLSHVACILLLMLHVSSSCKGGGDSRDQHRAREMNIGHALSNLVTLTRLPSEEEEDTCVGMITRLEPCVLCGYGHMRRRRIHA